MNIHITLLGREALPVYYPIKQLRPDKVYIIGTKDNKHVSDRLKELLTKGKKTKLGAMEAITKEVEIMETQAFDYKSTVEICERIQNRHHDLNGESFTYNITGGTKIMTIAAFEVGKKYKANIIYTDSKNIKHPFIEVKDEPLNCDIRTPEIISLQGQEIKEAIKFDKTDDKFEIEAARSVFIFWRKNRNIYHGLRDHLFGDRGNDNITIKNEFPFSIDGNQYHFKCKKNTSGKRQLTITNDFEEQYLHIKNCKDPKSMLLKGVWWELLVADAISKKFPDYLILRNVEFNPVEKTGRNNVKNEVDILVNIGNKLLFVECKSGRFDNSVINKMNTVRATFGGEKSKSVLVSATNTATEQYQHIHENAKDKDIPVISPKKEFADNDFLTKILPDLIEQFITKNII